MLVLSRRRDEVLCIGDDIEVTVVAIHGSKVRLGIDAPMGIRVDRKEVRQVIEQENANAEAKQSDSGE